MAAGTKRKQQSTAQQADDDALSDAQKKALMTRKQRKMYEGLRRREKEDSERVAALEAKRDAAKLRAPEGVR